MSRHWLYRGKVMHARLGEPRHAFAYDSLFLCFPLSGRQQLRSRLFSLNRWNLFSWHERDHGDGQNADAWIRALLQREGVATADGEVWLQTLPRMAGFVFNPISFWYCHDRADGLRAVLCEVRNTFGERHCYLLQPADGGLINDSTPLQSQKVFHVSPFYPVRGEYRFRFSLGASQRRIGIDYWQDGELSLKTAVTGQASALTDANLIKTCIQLGWATLLIVIRIHWQALLLWRKGVTFHRKPTPPAAEISR